MEYRSQLIIINVLSNSFWSNPLIISFIEICVPRIIGRLSLYVDGSGVDIGVVVGGYVGIGGDVGVVLSSDSGDAVLDW